MPSRVTPSVTREDSIPPDNDNNERSFVSTTVNNNSKIIQPSPSSRPTKGSRIDQSASATPSSPHRSLGSANSTTSAKSIIQTKEISTRIFKQDIFSSSSSQPSSQPLTSPKSPPVGSSSTQQPGVSSVDPRSPKTRRPPASRSSHGIETKSGPPPALSTQRSYTETPWRKSPPTDTGTKHPPLQSPLNLSESIDTLIRLPTDFTNEELRARNPHSAPGACARPSTSDGVMTVMEARNYRRSGNEEDGDNTLRLDGQIRRGEGRTQTADTQEHSQSSQEDLFLKLAQDDSVIDEPVSNSQRRRSRIGLSSFPQTKPSRPSSSGRPSTSAGSSGGYHPSADQNHSHKSSFDSYSPQSPGKSTLASLRDHSAQHRSYAASAHPLDQRQQTRSTRSSFGNKTVESSNEGGSVATPIPYGRRRSVREPSPGVSGRNYKQSNLSYIGNGDLGSSSNRFSPAYGSESVRGTIPAEVEGTESTVSTTAPSTVWDELDDLKSRLRKLELTGLLPKSSNAAISTVNGDRPPTATTTVTTISTSPKRHQVGSVSPEASTNKNSNLPNLHPLLHSALAKAKPIVNPNLYRALEATASDALALAIMTGSPGPQGTSSNPASVVTPTNGVDRQIRRKADSMCRSLTELCIAIAEESPEPEASTHQTQSRDVVPMDSSLPSPKLLRGASEEPETRTSSRVMSRLEARRTSLLASSPLTGRRGSAQESKMLTPASTPISNRLDRTSSTLVHKRSNGEEVETPNSRRPPSRSATEVGRTRPPAQARMSREYTSQHPLPGSSQQSPSTQSSLPTRKSYFTSATSSPLTPSVQPGNRRYLDRSTPPSSADSARLAEARQRRIASLGQGQSRLSLSSGRIRPNEPEQ